MPANTVAHLSALVVFLKTYLLQLNLFYTGIEEEPIIRNERRSTRLYLVLLLFSITFLTFYYTITPFKETIIIQSPSFLQYSTLAYQPSIQCPCSKIAIAYKEFIQIEPFYYELCQSYLISSDWINHLYSLYQQSWNNSISSDFRRIAVYQFQTIRSLCQLAKETNNNGLRSFEEKEFIQSQLLSSEVFQVQINSLITEFIDSLSKIFLSTLQFAQNTTAQSLLMTGGSLTSVLPNLQLGFAFNGYRIPFVGMVYRFSDGSTCTCSSSTATNCMGTATFENNTVDGFRTGCYMLNALLKSTLQTFYNQSFVNRLTNTPENLQQLNSSASNWTIETLLSEMFVDHWLNTTTYEQYFNACAPDLCQYTVNQRYDFLHIVALLIGLFGGLSSALRVLAPFILMTIWPAVYKLITRRQTLVNEMTLNENPTESSLQSLKRTIIELNAFKNIPPSQDESVLRQERQATCLYILLLLTGLSILTLFTSLRTQTISVTIPMPTSTQFIQLYDQYPLTLNCPCSQPSIKYNEFILSIEADYHPICSSEFVSSNWINLQFIKSPSTTYLVQDFRSQSETHFQLLATLCSASHQTVEDNIQSFYQTKFISQEVLNPQSFQIQTNLILEQFQRTMPEPFDNTLELLKANLELNQFIVPINSNFFLASPEDDMLTLSSYLYSERPGCSAETLNCPCSTLSTDECYTKTRIIDNEINFIIPGMYFSWFPLQSLLMSTLECLYNDSCLDQIKPFINTTVSPSNFSALQLPLESSTNNSHEQIEVLAKKLFIQSWKNQSSFQSYFNQCHPLTCQYTYTSRLSLIYMITTIIGLIGGLMVTSRLLAPLIVKLTSLIWNGLTRRRTDNAISQLQETSIRTGLFDRFRSSLKFITQTVIELNLFQTQPLSQDPKVLQRNRYSTRVYLILLISALFIIVIYTSLRRDTITDIENSPSVSKYRQLYAQYPVTLKCPCNHIAVKYNKFIFQMQPEYHQICSSPFASTEWIESLQSKAISFGGSAYDYDFRTSIRLQFLMISTFCSLSKATVNLSLAIFYQTDFVTARVISPSEFSDQIETIIQQFKRTTADQFMQIFQLIQATSYGNQLATGFSSNWRFVMKYHEGLFDPANDLTDLPALTRPKTYGKDNCSCAMQSNCSKLSEFPYRTSNQSLRQTLPGFRVGCLPLDALLQSTLTCLYNQTCLDLMRAALYYSKPVPVDILRYSSLAESNTTIETILSDLFVSNWLTNFSFDRYFNECDPQSCQYTYSTKDNSVYVITTVITLFGGLTKGLHFIVASFALIIFTIYDYRKKRSNIVNHCSVDPIDQQLEPRTTLTERIYLVSLSVMILVTIITASIVWSVRDGSVVSKTVLTNTLSTPTTSITTVTESTTMIIYPCHMTLKNQVQTYFTGLDPQSFLINDFNRDSILDIAVANYGDDTFSVLLGYGNGTFSTQLNFSTGNMTRPWGIAAGDFNNDTLLDLAISLSETNEVAIFYGIATNALFIPSLDTFTNNISANNRLALIETADLNTDGLIDLVVSNRMLPNIWGGAPLLIFFNTGDNRQFEFNPAFQYFGDYSLITIGDFDNDGRENDIGACTSTGILDIFEALNYSLVFPTNYRVYAMYGEPWSLTKGRFNADEFEDLALVVPQNDVLQILLAYGDGGFIQQIYPTAPYPASVTRINFNNDQIDDLAVLSCDRTVTVFLGTAIGLFDRNYLSFTNNKRYSYDCPHSLQVADLNQDGKDDLVFIDSEIYSIGVLLGTDCH